MTDYHCSMDTMYQSLYENVICIDSLEFPWGYLKRFKNNVAYLRETRE
jgi:hypothetical protein